MADTDITATTDRLFTLIRRTRPAPCDDPALDLITQREWFVALSNAVGGKDDEQCDALADAFFELEDAIARTEATTVAGLLAQLRLLANQDAAFCDTPELTQPLLATITAGLHRLLK